MIELLFDKKFLSGEEKKKCNEDFFQIKNEIEIFLDKILVENNFESIHKLIEVYNLFDFYKTDLDNKFVSFLHFSFFDFYILNIEKMIKLREDFAIDVLIDLFYCDERYFEDKKNKEKFNEKTYPILLLDTDNLSTFIAISCSRFISILKSEDVYKCFLEKYLKETKNFIYQEEVMEALKN
ncbi:hypothetical protein OA93_16475 [Flavobacterium sp. KMS]|uniref:hypothetical protein n=1 Tax=Flavobacterium sp. KMS TaxID=1566023 RepID=UPI00057DFCDF|nr:hypothetical protein [Flavobacterium sp. KMS]KIA96801.1 hypothetical protein OA93_16475 [Flavobacterium sp. KMS]